MLTTVRCIDDVSPAIEELVGYLRKNSADNIAYQLERVQEGYWATGGEYREQLDGVLQTILSTHTAALDELAIEQMVYVLTTIRKCADEATQSAIRINPPSVVEQPPQQPVQQPLSEWVRRREDD